MKKKIFIIAACVVVAATVAGVWIHLSRKKAIQNYVDKYYTILNINYPTDILIVGEDVNLRDGLVTRHVSQLSEEDLALAEGCIRQVIVLSDWNGTYNPEDKELRLIADHLYNGKCDFFCMGKALDSRLIEVGILTSPQDEGVWAPSRYWLYGELQYSNGLHTENATLDHISFFVVDKMAAELKRQYQ